VSPGTLPALTLDILMAEAKRFATIESEHWERTIYGTTDGKAIGTYVEAKFQTYLRERYDFLLGSAARGIDFPQLNVDLKVTSVRQPQSSCPFRSARQKVFGLGYSLLVFVYDKTDDQNTQTGRLSFAHTIFVEATRTADYQTTLGVREILAKGGNADDLMAFMNDRGLPGDEIQHRAIAEEALQTTPELGYLTISNALQWRLQYGRAIEQADHVSGVRRVK
jgi:hypothetical protein